MNPETLLRDTFEAHEHLAPDAGGVLSAVHDRVRSPRVRAGRLLAVAASIAVVAGAAGIAVLASGQSSEPAPQKVAAQPTATLTHVVQPHSAGIDALTMPFDLGWLPDGEVHYLAQRINVGGLSDSAPPVFDGEYLMTITGGGRPIDVDVQQMPGGLDGVMFKSGPGEHTTVAGHMAIQSSNSAGPGGYEVYFLDGAGGLVYVNAGPSAGGTVPAADLVSIGRQVAENVEFPGTKQVEPTFGIGYIPDGLTMRAFDIGAGGAPVGTPTSAGGTEGPRTSYELGTTTDQSAEVYLGQGGLIDDSAGQPGRSVQGHPARLLDDGGWRTLSVQGAVGDDAVSLSGRVPFDELYAVADGLVLP